MHIGFRYHVATLMAVFFSLFLGIIVGSIIFQDDLLVQEQNSIINELENKFNQLQSWTKELQTNLKQAEMKEALLAEGWDLIRHALIADQLQGRQVVLLAEGVNTGLVKRLAAVLKDAGAQVVDTVQWPSSADGLELVLKKLDALNLDQPVAVIWVDKQDSSVVKQGVDYLRQLKWQICILQPYNSSMSLATFAQDALIIDIGDTFLGELAMIWGLNAGLTGMYGHGSTAVALLPVLDSE
ncbi:MAG TPA: copper transporter [Firmicutes bacterium]|nr:copper transporter [Bacillota bacterium]